MPAKGRGFSKNPADWQDIKFARVSLSTDQKKAFKALKQAEKAELMDKTVRMIVSGHKASITYDNSNQCFIFSLTCKMENHVNFNVCMTSRSDDMWEAMALASYKTLYCCPDGEWMTEGDDNFG